MTRQTPRESWIAIKTPTWILHSVIVSFTLSSCHRVGEKCRIDNAASDSTEAGAAEQT